MIFSLYNADCLEKLREFPDNSVDSIVTDPPGGIAFMGNDWDKDKGGRDCWIEWMTSIASECIRVLKPGGHCVVWAIPRTSHWTATAWEDAGFECKDKIFHCFGSGFPKNFNVSLNIDKKLGCEREVIGIDPSRAARLVNQTGEYITDAGWSAGGRSAEITAPASDDAKKWDGWGTALKPSVEEWLLFKKPNSEKTIVDNVLKWGTGALNIKACRVGDDKVKINKLKNWSGFGQEIQPDYTATESEGRWPAQLIHDGSDEVKGVFPNNNPGCKPHVITASDETAASNREKGWGSVSVPKNKMAGFNDGDDKSASRFFKQVDWSEDDFAYRVYYAAKPSKKEKNLGLEGMPKKQKVFNGQSSKPSTDMKDVEKRFTTQPAANIHPTVKCEALMRYLCRLVTPVGGVVLDPFMGSGTTGIASLKEGFRFIGIEREREYFEICVKRIEFTAKKA